MSMVVTRSPLTAIVMNGAGPAAPKRRSARLSVEGQEEEEEQRPSKKTKVDTTQSAGSAKESGAGKRTRGKGRNGHLSQMAAAGRRELKERKLTRVCSLRQQGRRLRIHKTRKTHQKGRSSQCDSREGLRHRAGSELRNKYSTGEIEQIWTCTCT